MFRRRVAASLVALVLGTGLAVATAGPASAVVICEQFGFTVVENRYIVQNNRWGASTPQCISTSGSGFTITQADHNNATNGAPASYPSVFYGWHYGNASPGTILPLRLSDSAVSGISTSVDYTFVSGATYNAAYDIWLDPTPRTNGQNTGAEIMVWANRQGPIQPVGSRVGTVSLLGATWEVWFGNIGWNVISYVRSSPTSSLSFPITTFTDDAIARGYAERSWYLTSIQAGFEPWVNGTGLAVNRFSVTTGGTEPTTPPTTTPPTTPGGCTANFTMVREWSGGFHGEVTVRNTGSASTSGWTVSGTLAAGQGITNSWNTNLSTSGSSFTARNAPYNGTLAGGASTTFGFIGSGPATAPSVTCSST